MNDMRIEARIEATGITVERSGRRILDGLDLTVGAGEVVGLIGPNGAGKSTLLRSLIGLQEVSGGDIRIAGTALGDWGRSELGRAVAYLPQHGAETWPIRVDRFVALGRLPHLEPWRGPTAADEDTVARAMTQTDVAEFADRPVTALSGGERARVHLARALAVGAPILLADEPITGLDPYHQLHVMTILKRRATADGTAVVVVLHDLTLAHRFCDRLVLIDDGRIAAEGEPDAVLTGETLAKVYRVSVFRSGLGESGTGGQSVIVPLACLEGGGDGDQR